MKETTNVVNETIDGLSANPCRRCKEPATGRAGRGAVPSARAWIEPNIESMLARVESEVECLKVVLDGTSVAVTEVMAGVIRRWKNEMVVLISFTEGSSARLRRVDGIGFALLSLC